MEGDGCGAGVSTALGGEAAGLVDEFFGEIEGRESTVTEAPKSECHATGTAAGFEEGHGLIRKEALDQCALGRPEAEFVRGTRVVDDREEIVEIGADGGGGYFLRVHAAMNMPLASISCGQRVCVGPGSSSGWAVLKAAVTAVVSLRVRVQTE